MLASLSRSFGRLGFVSAIFLVGLLFTATVVQAVNEPTRGRSVLASSHQRGMEPLQGLEVNDTRVDRARSYAFTNVTGHRPASATFGLVTCFTEYTNDGVTDFSSADAQAVRDALGAVGPGGVVKV